MSPLTAVLTINVGVVVRAGMCGIWLKVSARNGGLGVRQLPQWLLNRGPDYSRIDQVTGSVCIGASILHIQGDTLTQQPLRDEFGNVLAFNGEIFQSDPVRGDAAHSSDTDLLMNHLGSVSSASEAVPLLEGYRGPFAFIFYHRASDSIWFGRDFFGRRSLVLRRTADSLQISSVCADPEADWHEIACSGLFSVPAREATSPSAVQHHRWSHLRA